MGTITEVTRTGNQITASIDTSNVALGNNEFTTAEYTSTGAIVIAEGTVFGRISATGKIAILAHGATDGSQYPVGIMYNGIAGSKSIGASTTVELTLITKGDVDSSKLVFDGATTTASVVSDIRLGDRLSQIGINLVSCNEVTKLDNL